MLPYMAYMDPMGNIVSVYDPIKYLQFLGAIAGTWALPLPDSSASPGCHYLKGRSLARGDVAWEQLQNSWVPA